MTPTATERHTQQVSGQSGPRQGRSGEHLRRDPISGIYYYRRVVPKELRVAFGQSEVLRSLGTRDKNEAKRREKSHDVRFEERLRKAREAGDPKALAARIAERVRPQTEAYFDRQGFPADPRLNAHLSIRSQLEDAPLTEAARAEAADLAYRMIDDQFARAGAADKLGREIRHVLTGLNAEQVAQARSGILSLVKQIATPRAPVEESDAKTLEWAYRKWLGTHEEGSETADAARLALDKFTTYTGIVMLADVQRDPVLEWRDNDLQKQDPPLAPNTINKRLQLLRPIVYVGCRAAKVPKPDLEEITLPREESEKRDPIPLDTILKILEALAEEPLWARWCFIIALTTSTRISEIVGAQVGSYNALTGFVESKRVATKGKRGRRKLHAMPILDWLSRPFLRYIDGRPKDEYLLADAPHAANKKLPAGHEASKWFDRFFDRIGVDVTFHETKHTWIHHARYHSKYKRDLWEIITGHSGKCMSDHYGGEEPKKLLAVNKAVCRYLTKDAKIKTAMLRLIE